MRGVGGGVSCKNVQQIVGLEMGLNGWGHHRKK